MQVCECIFLVREVCRFYQILKGSFDDGDYGDSDVCNGESLASEMVVCLDLLQRVGEAVHRR